MRFIPPGILLNKRSMKQCCLLEIYTVCTPRHYLMKLNQPDEKEDHMQVNRNWLFFYDLIRWIENNLDKDLSLKAVADKSGYSMWYLQRQFRLYSGMTLGTYIRRRRLTMAAIALKTTVQSPVEIAISYRWDSQQTFTRTFKKYFGKPPVQWRNAREWNMSNMQFPLYVKSNHEAVNLFNLEHLISSSEC